MTTRYCRGRLSWRVEGLLFTVLSIIIYPKFFFSEELFAFMGIKRYSLILGGDFNINNL